MPGLQICNFYYNTSKYTKLCLASCPSSCTFTQIVFNLNCKCVKPTLDIKYFFYLTYPCSTEFLYLTVDSFM